MLHRKPSGRMVKRLRAAMCRTINVRQGQSMPQEYPQASLLAQPLSCRGRLSPRVHRAPY